MALWTLPGTTQVSWYQKKHSPTHTIMVINHQLSPSSIFYNPPWHPPCSIYVPHSLFPQSPSKWWDSGMVICLGRGADWFYLPVMVSGVSRGMDVLDGGVDHRRGRGSFGSEFRASPCNQWGVGTL